MVTVAPDGAVDSTGYDASGNAVTVIPRLGGPSHAITMRYDALNRLCYRVVPAYTYAAEAIGLAASGSAWWHHPYPLHPNVAGQSGYTVPAEVDTVAYDGAGRLVTANNGDAQVSRSYYPNGLLHTETARLRTRAEGTGWLRAQDLGAGRADTLRYDAAGNRHALLTTTAGNPKTYSLVSSMMTRPVRRS